MVEAVSSIFIMPSNYILNDLGYPLSLRIFIMPSNDILNDLGYPLSLRFKWASLVGLASLIFKCRVSLQHSGIDTVPGINIKENIKEKHEKCKKVKEKKSKRY